LPQRQSRETELAPVLGEMSIQPRTTLDLHLRTEHVRLGQNRIALRMPWDSIDYSDYRSRFLQTVVAHQSTTGEAHPPLKPLEIWAAMGEEGKFPDELMRGIKKWLPKLTYRRQPLIEWNGKRGRGATYAVNQKFQLNLLEKKVELLIPEIELPDADEVYETVRHLSQFDFVLREYGILEMEPGLEIALQSHKPDYTQLKNSGKSIQDFRAGALAKAEQLLGDQQYIGRYKKSLDKASPEYGLLRYIYDLTPDERFFMRKLLKSKVEPVLLDGNLRLEAVDERGMLIAVLTPSLLEKPVENSTETEAEQTTVSSENTEIIFDRRAQTADSTEGEVDLRNERLESLLEVVEAVADEVAATFLVSLKASKVYRLAQVQAVFPKLTINKFMSAKKNNIINPVREQPISLEDVIRIMLHSDPYLRNVFTTRKYRDQINGIVNKVIERNTQRVEQELSGEY
jgi:hypothetical protein